jgi:hypothetical protein
VDQNVIDGIMTSHRNQEWINNENKAGIEQLSYSSMQGAEYLFPNYFPTTYRDRQIEGRLSDSYDAVVNLETRGANLIGTFAAAWDDAGLHSETFWLGWATVTQYGWTKSTPRLQQSTADFMDLFYGFESQDMTEAYVLLEEGARYYEALWDQVVSTERIKGYGSSFGKGIGGDMTDLTLQMPPLPSLNDLGMGMELSPEHTFRSRYEAEIHEASLLLVKNDRLISRLMQNMTRVSHNTYNLEVLLSLAYLERYTIETVLKLATIEESLEAASETKNNPAKAVDLLIAAHKLSGEIIRDQEIMWSDFTATWNKSRLPKNQSVGNKDYLHEFDDVKDHFADRRKGLEYMLAPFERMGMDHWRKQLEDVVIEFAKIHKIPASGLEATRLED